MENEKTEKKNRRNKIIIIVIIIILLLLMLVKLYFEFRAERQRFNDLRASALEKSRIALEFQNLRSMIDSLCNVYPQECKNFEMFANTGNLMSYANSLNGNADTAVNRDSTDKTGDSSGGASQNGQGDLLKNDTKNTENTKTSKEIADSIEQENLRKKREQENADDLKNKNFAEKSCKDTVAPWIYPEPTGGVYFEPIKVKFFVSKPCSVFYKRSKDADFRHWAGEIISITQNGEIYYYAVDSCGNEFPEQKKVYELREKTAQNVCPDNMVFIESSHGNFCIDQYEWTNKKGVYPVNMVSQSEARDSCASVGKRLCSADEWTIACKGPYNWKYPYGNQYMRKACITQDSTYRKSGEAGECRGWYAIYDMTGNLAEWTSTRSNENNRFFIVKGGFWESGQSADCEMSRYSYYPQNRHNPIGFRCCKGLE